MILDYFSRALREQPAEPHTHTSSHKTVKTNMGETTPRSKAPSLPLWATTAFPAQGKHLVGVASDPGAVELYWHVSSKTHSSPHSGQGVGGVSADRCPRHSQLCFINLFALRCVWGSLLVHIQSLPCFEKWGLESGDLHPAM